MFGIPADITVLPCSAIYKRDSYYFAILLHTP